MNILLVISSIVLLVIGAFAVLQRETLWAAHARRSEMRGKIAGDETAWKRNLSRGGWFLIALGILGIASTILAAATPPA